MIKELHTSLKEERFGLTACGGACAKPLFHFILIVNNLSSNNTYFLVRL